MSLTHRDADSLSLEEAKDYNSSVIMLYRLSRTSLIHRILHYSVWLVVRSLKSHTWKPPVQKVVRWNWIERMYLDVQTSIHAVFSIWYKTVLFWRAIKCFSSTNHSFLKNWTARIRNLCSIKFLNIVKTAKPNKDWKSFQWHNWGMSSLAFCILITYDN